MKKVSIITSPIDDFIKESTSIIPIQSQSKSGNIDINHHFTNIINTSKDGVLLL